jgi:AcrR family transcriptional regulator
MTDFFVVVVLSALDLHDSSIRTALEVVAGCDNDGLIRLEAMLALVRAGVCNDNIARMMAALLPQLNLQSSIWASKYGIFDAVRVLPCVPEMVKAVAAICSDKGASARLQELLLSAVHSSSIVTDQDAIALSEMMVQSSDLAQLCVQPLWHYMVKHIQEAKRMLPNEIVDLLRSASGTRLDLKLQTSWHTRRGIRICSLPKAFPGETSPWCEPNLKACCVKGIY